MKYLKGIVSNVKIHQEESTISSKERTESTTRHKHTFDIDGIGLFYQAGSPAGISDNDLLAVAYKKLFGRSVKAIWNNSNLTYSGPNPWSYYILAFIVSIALILAIYFNVSQVVEQLINVNNFFDFPASVWTIASIILCASILLLIMCGINTNRMIKKLKNL